MTQNLQVRARNGSAAARLKLENSRLLREEIAAGRVELRGLPEIVTFNSTDICNLRCVMCPRHYEQGKHRLDDGVVELVAAELLPTAMKVVMTTAGGEPLGVGFEAIVDAARRHETRLDVVTNGILMDERKFDLMRPVLDHLNISVDCAVPAIYEKIRLGSSFDKLVERLTMVRERRRDGEDDMLFSLSGVVMASNLPHLADLVRFAAKFGVDGVALQRLRHEVPSSRDEEPTRHFSAAEIDRHLAAAEDAARDVGVNLLATSLGRAPVWVRPIRAKVPPTIDDAGVCYFLSQSFSVMYTGEVYPCCKPTDYMLGDVRYESPLAIWNGEPLRRLRQAHYDRRGTVFCSGCEYAPHLPKRRAAPVQDVMRRGRLWLGRLSTSHQRRRRAGQPVRSASQPAPTHERVENAFSDGELARHVEALSHARDASALGADGRFWFVADGQLFAASEPLARPAPVVNLDEQGRRCALLTFVAGDTLLASFEESGELLRVVVSASARTQARSVLALSDGRSHVRAGGVAVDRDGVVWVGEYGTAPGVRCAVLYRSHDAGATFTRFDHVLEARHVHAVEAGASSRQVFVTTGDFGPERATHLVASRGERLERWLAPWSGFTAVAETADFVHFGTDLENSNGLVRVPLAAVGAAEPAVEFRPFPEHLDLQVRQLEAVSAMSLVALCSADENLADLRRGRRACVLTSDDAGASWQVRHRFSADWSDAPERFVLIGSDPIRLACDGADRASYLQL